MDKATGGISSIFDKQLSQELVEQENSYKFNQYIYERIFSKKGRKLLWDIDTLGFPGTKGIGARFSRFYPRHCHIKKGQDGHLTASLLIKSVASGAKQISQEIVIYNDIKRIDFINTIYKTEEYSPEAVYYAFAFNLVNSEIVLDTNGLATKPETDQLPGTVRDIYSANWISMSNGLWGIIWATNEAPVVHLFDINTGKFENQKNPSPNSSIFSCVMNNYWYTNFKASQSGKMTFHYSITSFPGKPTATIGSTFFQQCFNMPMASHFTQCKTGCLPAKNFSFLSIDKKNVNVLAVKKAEMDNSFIIRLQEIEGKNTWFKIMMPHLKIEKAILVDIAENNLTQLSVRDNVINHQIKHSEILTLKIFVQNLETPPSL